MIWRLLEWAKGWFVRKLWETGSLICRGRIFCPVTDVIPSKARNLSKIPRRFPPRDDIFVSPCRGRVSCPVSCSPVIPSKARNLFRIPRHFLPRDDRFGASRRRPLQRKANGLKLASPFGRGVGKADGEGDVRAAACRPYTQSPTMR